MTDAPEHAKESTGLVLPNTVYDNLRWLINYVVPAAVIFYVGVDTFFPVWEPAKVAGVAGLAVVFFNVLLNRSKTNYVDQKTLRQGVVVVNTKDFKQATIGVGLEGIDPLELAGKDTLTLKVKSDTDSQ